MTHYLDIIPWYETKYNNQVCKTMYQKSGFFPKKNKELLERFGEEYFRATASTDLMKSIPAANDVSIIQKIKRNMVFIESKKTRPWFQETPWTKCLESRKVLIVSPFVKDIVRQYSKRGSIHENNKVLPKFHLDTVKAFNTRGKNPERFGNWFEALNFMKGEIFAKDFDVALLGCGAYGMPLCRFIKEEMNNTAIYMGSGLQLLFGLKGARWEGKDEYENIFNSNWVFPSDNVSDPDDLPKSSKYGRYE
jgi:hypothetical protein